MRSALGPDTDTDSDSDADSDTDAHRPLQVEQLDTSITIVQLDN